MDEMKITSKCEYDVSSNVYYGDVTFPGQTGKATHALVFMLGGISTRWKQVIAYYFTNGTYNSGAINDVVKEIIKEVEKLGLVIMCITSDMGSSNQAMWNSFQIKVKRKPKGVIDKSCSVVNPYHSNRTIHFIADVPHLIKNIRTSLLNNESFILPQSVQEKYNLPTNVVDPKHLEELVNFQDDMDLKLAPKLKQSHLNPNHFQKMKVSNAAYVISHDVSSALKYLADDFHDDSYLTTAWFFEKVNHWFTLMTSRNPTMAISKFKETSYTETITFLQEIIDLFEKLKIRGRSGRATWKPIQTGVILSTTSVIEIQEELLNKQNFKFLLTSRLMQDSLENLFGLVRSKQVIPTALQFKNNLKLICVAQYMKPCSTGSYNIDDREFLSGFFDTLKVNKSTTHECYKIVLPKDWDKEASSSLSHAERQCLFYIAGYIISSVAKNNGTCSECLAAAGSKEKSPSIFSKLVALREFKDNCLFYVKSDLFYIFYKMELIFRKLEPFLIKERQNCKMLFCEKVNDDLDVKNFSLPLCHKLKEKILNRFISFRLKIFGIKRSKELLKKAKSKSIGMDYGSKSSAMRAFANNLDLSLFTNEAF